ncbi:hypothetical protein [Kineococcus indalonis]|uniref:hypothetical protein n=1 Tax=Kineococcus indalonis TaxID=2696566 RepID=UPI001411CCCD|nr:hypothetical protein [Kineococcus indalonis]NAZ86685.1 hypothetical protein [Kineococcus indalonis]
MDVLVGVLAVAGTAGGIGAVLAAAFGGSAARAGRRDAHLLVAPRGAGYGEAGRLVVEAARAERDAHAAVVHLDERRARRAGTDRAA